MRLSFLMLAFLSASFCQSAHAQEDLDKLQGYWRVAAVGTAGRMETAAPPPIHVGLWIQIRERNVVVQGSPFLPVEAQLRIRLRPKRTPKTIEISAAWDEKDTCQGHYRLAGDGVELTLPRASAARFGIRSTLPTRVRLTRIREAQRKVARVLQGHWDFTLASGKTMAKGKFVVTGEFLESEGDNVFSRTFFGSFFQIQLGATPEAPVDGLTLLLSGKTLPALSKRVGDTVRICYRMKEGRPPAAIDPKEGSLVTLQRPTAEEAKRRETARVARFLQRVVDGPPSVFLYQRKRALTFVARNFPDTDVARAAIGRLAALPGDAEIRETDARVTLGSIRRLQKLRKGNAVVAARRTLAELQALIEDYAKTKAAGDALADAYQVARKLYDRNPREGRKTLAQILAENPRAPWAKDAKLLLDRKRVNRRDASRKLNLAKKFIGVNAAAARRRLREVVQMYPGSKEAKEALALLKGL